MAKKPILNSGQLDLFDDWLIVEPPAVKPVVQIKDSLEVSSDDMRHLLALRLAQRLGTTGEITSKSLTEEANRAFGGTQADGTYSSKDAYDALEAAFNIHLLGTEDAHWTEHNADAAKNKVIDLTNWIQQLPTQTRRDDEMEEFQQFSTPPALSFVANWVANVKKDEVMVEPSAGTGDLAIWAKIAGANLVLNELSPRRHALLSSLFPQAKIYKENAEQLDNVLPFDIKPTVIVMNPPFSSTAGRVQGQRDSMNGARHIEQALKRLEDNGRLVAIVGNGMAADRPAFAQWWKDIEKKYNVRANVGISGKEYAKYGTTFDNQILVIDKTGATTQPVLTGKVESVADLPTLLEGIRNDRQQIQSTSIKPTSIVNTQSKQHTVQPGNRSSGLGAGESGTGTESIGHGSDSGTVTTDSQIGSTTTSGDGVNDGIGTGNGIRVRPVGDVGGSGGGDTGGNSGITKSNDATRTAITSKVEEDHLFDVLETTLVVDPKAAKEFSHATGVILGTANQNAEAIKQWRKEQRNLKPEHRMDVLGFIPDDLQRLHRVGQYAKPPTLSLTKDTRISSSDSIVIEAKSGEVAEFTDSVFSNYTPQRLSIPGAKQHPGKLVQSAAMSAVEPPAPTYSPKLPINVIDNGLLSIAQLESVVYAGQAHSEKLPSGSRKGFFIGDGTGVGKGREISGIILDNMMQGRNKAVWVSFNEGLVEDAKRDFAGVGGDPKKIFFQGKTKASGEITQKDGILFTTYSTLRGGEKKQATDLGQIGGKTRAQQIIDWLGEDFDGVIAFDEAHSMGNAIAVKGNRGVKKPSQQAIAGINLQKALPDARVIYVSATGATEISNLSYADRLGLWGEGTPFADTNTFISNVSKGGLASMELISRDMKAMGMYIARSLSYDGVSYERLDHELTDLQEDIYNELAGAWQVVLENVDQALEITQAGKNGNGKSAAMSQFWGAHQRFFNQIITAMQTPTVIDDIRSQIEVGNVAVIQLVNTNEATQERIIADATANDLALEDLDFTPRQMLMDYVRNGFPVAAYEESVDSNGNKTYLPVKDSEGNPVFDREAVALRDKLLETLQQIRVTENPLDSIINAFGSDRVAEVTGRSRRFVQTRDEEGGYKVVEEKRGKNSSRHDAEAFQANKKDILIFSGAGGTGYSFHADNTAENQRRRIHYILQPGWQAHAAVQGFGRTHRTNQANEPHYVLPTTNLKAQKRFVSSIARRLDQLGALTRGQREATSQGMFTASDNLESQYAATALKNFFSDLYRGKTDLSFHDVTKQMGLNLLDENASLSESKIPAIPQFLNRLLSLKTDMQNVVFGEFEKRLVEAVEYAKQRGMFDQGLQTMKAMSIIKTREDVAYEDKNTGAQTRYVELAVANEVKYTEWEEAKKMSKMNRKEGDLAGWYVFEIGKNKGDVFYLSDIGQRLDSEGKEVHRGVVHTIRSNAYRYIDNADIISRGYDYRTVSANGVSTSQKVNLTRAIDEAEAEKLWKEQVDSAPKTETKTERMLVGVILPIWDRVEGSEFIQRLQTDDGEVLLGRMLGPKSAEKTLKNLGLDSSLANMSSSDLFESIKNGNKAILSNGWEISTAKVNHEDRIEVKGRTSFTSAEKRVLQEQGTFSERIAWVERVFIPTGVNGLSIFERITASKPVIDLISKDKAKGLDQNEDDDSIVQESNSFTPPGNIQTTHVAASVKSLPDGWTESEPGGLVTNPDPISGGIIDSEILSGNWFVIPNNDAIAHINDLGSRSEAIKALQNAVIRNQLERLSNLTDQTVQDNAPKPEAEPDSLAVTQANLSHLDNQGVIQMETKKKPFHETVAEKLIEQLEKGTAPWQKPWNPGESNAFLPFNPTTGNRYKGINSIHLMSQDRDDQRWMTYKQAGELGGQVKKGEKGTLVQYWKFTEEQTKRDDNGKPVLNSEGDPIKVVVKLERPKVFNAVVFNAEQIDGLPPLEKKPQTWDAIERAEHILTASGADIQHNGGGRAFYRPRTDSIHLPDKGAFSSAENYYATALHELGHWTGHEDRLNRGKGNPFGSEAYAKEELRAEIASMILGDELGIGHDPSQHAAYVGSWIKALKDDPMEIFRAAADAEKIQNYVLAFERKQVQEQENVQVQQQNAEPTTISTVLDVDIDTVLNNTNEYTFDHFQDFEGDNLGAALRKEGLNTVVDVTGNNSDQFFETAIKNLSPVFGVAPDDNSMSNAYLERKGLAQAFMSTAELLVQEQAQSLIKPTTKIEEGVAMVNSDNTDNSTKQLIANVVSIIETVQDGISEWRSSFARDEGTNHTQKAIEYAREGRIDKAIESLWNNVTLEDSYGKEDQYDFRDAVTAVEVELQLWQQNNGVGPVITPEMLNSFNAIPSDLSQLSSATVEDYEKAAEMARFNEEQVKNDPNSTAEDITAAREERKTAELVATVNNEAFQQTVAKLDQKQETGQGQGGEKNYINVPFKDKDEAKALGAAWDGAKRSWYVPPNVDQAPFSKWANPQPILAAKKSDEPTSQERQYLAVPYSERKEARSLGAKWDGGNKAWYVGPSADISKLQKWLPDNVKSQQDPAMSPDDEFTEALRSVGCIVKGDHPIMDGKKHRIETTGDKAGEKAGFYFVHMDGHPAGFIQNNRTGEKLKWKAKGYALSEGDKAKLQAESATKLQGRQEEENARHQAVAGAVRQLLAVAPPAQESHQYLQSKQARPGDLTVVPNDAGGLPADSIVLIGKNWKESKELREQYKDKLVFTAGDMLVAASDINGDVQSVQSIQSNGRKMFATGGQKQGTFHVVGGDGLNAIADAPAIVIGEGYATADTLSQSLGYATVAAFDSGNLPVVAKQLQEKFPDKLIVIAGDNDLHQEMTEGKNPGKQKALSAAVAVNGVAIFPVFAPGEQSYPAGIDKITPEMARNNVMSQEQSDAIAKMRQFTDFNDLATKSDLGQDGVERQVRLFVDDLVEQHQAQAQQQQLTKRQAVNDDQLHQQRKSVKI
ncbi:strawberry notch-like NTP hydrolase domain-containing protein [Methylomonas sp. AM2-LC]|uniref:strawberry notch-like NTP hydrolase domain-containing protein n=1 Tax=Methylomonas sp. AM2-LC TaxID=3153301 RepID=UPI003263B2B2